MAPQAKGKKKEKEVKNEDGALRPAPLNFAQFINKKEVEKDQPLVDEEIMAHGGSTDFWRVLKTHFDESISTLEQINEAAIASGMAFDEIGRNALVISQVKAILKKIINAVEDAKEAQDAKPK